MISLIIHSARANSHLGVCELLHLFFQPVRAFGLGVGGGNGDGGGGNGGAARVPEPQDLISLTKQAELEAALSQQRKQLEDLKRMMMTQQQQVNNLPCLYVYTLIL